LLFWKLCNYILMSKMWIVVARCQVQWSISHSILQELYFFISDTCQVTSVKTVKVGQEMLQWNVQVSCQTLTSSFISSADSSESSGQQAPATGLDTFNKRTGRGKSPCLIPFRGPNHQQVGILHAIVTNFNSSIEIYLYWTASLPPHPHFSPLSISQSSSSAGECNLPMNLLFHHCLPMNEMGEVPVIPIKSPPWEPEVCGEAWESDLMMQGSSMM